jgi:hypothetical protein
MIGSSLYKAEPHTSFQLSFSAAITLENGFRIKNCSRRVDHCRMDPYLDLV